jgi:hypothetical protein
MTGRDRSTLVDRKEVAEQQLSDAHNPINDGARRERGATREGPTRTRSYSQRCRCRSLRSLGMTALEILIPSSLHPLLLDISAPTPSIHEYRRT